MPALPGAVALSPGGRDGRMLRPSPARRWSGVARRPGRAASYRMCGIAGVVGNDGRPGDGPAALAMCARMLHPGPDDDGLYVPADLALGARRLSIIDVAGGHRPIGNEGDSSIVPTYLLSRSAREHLSGRRDHRKPLWNRPVFQRWHEALLEKRPRPPAPFPAPGAGKGAGGRAPSRAPESRQ
jgi:hypothetical protein